MKNSDIIKLVEDQVTGKGSKIKILKVGSVDIFHVLIGDNIIPGEHLYPRVYAQVEVRLLVPVE